MMPMIDPFYVMEVVAAAERHELEGNAVFHLEVGQPSTPAPVAARERAHELLDTSMLGYTISRGIPELPVAIASHVEQWYGLDVDPERVAITQGATGAFVLTLLAAFEPGARIGVPVPGYPCYRNMVAALHMEAVPIRVGPDTDFRLTTDHLAEAGPLDGVIVASPSNPTGTVLEPSELAALVSWCDDRGVRFVSDEIYHGLTYGDTVAQTATALSDRAVVVNSFSKYFSMTGWRIGWAVLPDDLVTPFDRLAQNLVICPPSLSQQMALVALRCHDELGSHVTRYAANRDILLEGLPRASIDDLAPADGAFYVWGRTDHLAADSKDLAAAWLRETGVAATPGVDFDPDEGHRFMRFSFCGSEETMRGAVRALETWRLRQLAH